MLVRSDKSTICIKLLIKCVLSWVIGMRGVANEIKNVHVKGGGVILKYCVLPVS